MRSSAKLVPIAVLGVLGLSGCSDFLEPREAVVDPNRPTTATAQNLFVGAQTAIWSYLASDPIRTTGIWAQQLTGVQGQYLLTQQYSNSETTTNGFNQGLYISGGLGDIRRAQAITEELEDDVFTGILQVQEAILVGIGADLFGDIVYSQALTNTENPALDQQLDVYADLQELLDAAITNLAATGPTNIGPGEADLAYGGDPELWTKLAHTLKARLYFRTAEVDPTSYQRALEQARLGLTDPAEDFVAPFSGSANEQNFWYQFFVVQREGYIRPGSAFVTLLQTRSDPRLDYYFDDDGAALSSTLLSPSYAQPLISANENLLNWAEAAYRTGNPDEARTQLNAERANWADVGVTLAPIPNSVTGLNLLREILTERYIALFQTYEPYEQYKRTCFPNLAPAVAGGDVPARLYYDTSERQTNTSIPAAGEQPLRNDNDPVNGTDPFGNACLAEPSASTGT